MPLFAQHYASLPSVSPPQNGASGSHRSPGAARADEAGGAAGDKFLSTPPPTRCDDTTATDSSAPRCSERPPQPAAAVDAPRTPKAENVGAPAESSRAALSAPRSPHGAASPVENTSKAAAAAAAAVARAAKASPAKQQPSLPTPGSLGAAAVSRARHADDLVGALAAASAASVAASKAAAARNEARISQLEAELKAEKGKLLGAAAEHHAALAARRAEHKRAMDDLAARHAADLKAVAAKDGAARAAEGASGREDAARGVRAAVDALSRSLRCVVLDAVGEAAQMPEPARSRKRRALLMHVHPVR